MTVAISFSRTALMPVRVRGNPARQ